MKKPRNLAEWELWALDYMLCDKFALSFDEGMHYGLNLRASEIENYQKQIKRFEALPAARDSYIKLINAVGQTMNVNSQLITGLAQTLDNGPR